MDPPPEHSVDTRARTSQKLRLAMLLTYIVGCQTCYSRGHDAGTGGKGVYGEDTPRKKGKLTIWVRRTDAMRDRARIVDLSRDAVHDIMARHFTVYRPVARRASERGLLHTRVARRVAFSAWHLGQHEERWEHVA